jgi:hypothetical protein
MAGIGIAVAAMLLDMLARSVFGPARPVDPIDDPPSVSCPTCPAGRVPLAEAPAAAADEVHDLAALKPAKAAELDGKKALFRVVIDIAAGGDLYEVLPRDDPQGTLFLAKRRPGARDLTGEVTVRGTLHVVHREGFTIGKVKVAPYTEYRLADAELVCP